MWCGHKIGLQIMRIRVLLAGFSKRRQEKRACLLFIALAITAAIAACATHDNPPTPSADRPGNMGSPTPPSQHTTPYGKYPCRFDCTYVFESQWGGELDIVNQQGGSYGDAVLRWTNIFVNRGLVPPIIGAEYLGDGCRQSEGFWAVVFAAGLPSVRPHVITTTCAHPTAKHLLHEINSTDFSAVSSEQRAIFFVWAHNPLYDVPLYCKKTSNNEWGATPHGVKMCSLHEYIIQVER
jgi:hypothetical protein